MKVELDLSNYAAKADLENIASVNSSKFTKKVDLINLKLEFDKLNIDKLEKVPTGLNSLKSKIDRLCVDKLVPVLVDLSKLSDVVKNDVVKKDLYNTKIKDIEDKIPDITNLATNATLNAQINEVKNEIPSINNLVTTASHNIKINDFKNKLPSITNFAATTYLTADENKICDHSKYITTLQFNKLTTETFTARLKQTCLTDIR